MTLPVNLAVPFPTVVSFAEPVVVPLKEISFPEAALIVVCTFEVNVLANVISPAEDEIVADDIAGVPGIVSTVSL